MTGRAAIVAGISLSLTGALQRQGREAHDGVRLWAEHVERMGGLGAGRRGQRRPLRLVALDDGSMRVRAADNVERLQAAERVDVVLGPYSSGLTLATAPLVAARGKLLWNHGGASDTLAERGWRHVVSVPTPASHYFRDLPRVVKARTPGARRAGIVHRTRGTFAAHVRRGVEQAARAAGFAEIHATPFETPVRDANAVLARALEGEPDLLVGIGAFEDDVALARAWTARATGGTVAFVAAGLDAFGDHVGPRVDGMIGPSQWEPGVYENPAIGPSSARFCTAFHERFGRAPGYVAAQAYAIGVVVAECIEQAGTLEDDALLRVACGLDTTTMYGGFRLDAASLRQVGHRVLLVEWRAGRRTHLRRDDATSSVGG
jgi:branched-chain amino acid transport system substrate-binding protein